MNGSNLFRIFFIYFSRACIFCVCFINMCSVKMITCVKFLHISIYTYMYIIYLFKFLYLKMSFCECPLPMHQISTKEDVIIYDYGFFKQAFARSL